MEVAVSSRRRDLRKADAYARARVWRYWIVDAANDCVLEHTEPSDDGYGLVRRLTGDDVLDTGVAGIPPLTVAALLAP